MKKSARCRPRTSPFLCWMLSWIALTARADSSASRVTLASELLLWSVTCIGETMETTCHSLQASSGAEWRDLRTLRLAQHRAPHTSTWGNAAKSPRLALEPRRLRCLENNHRLPSWKQTGKNKI